MEINEQTLRELLDAKDATIALLEKQNELLKSLAESRRLAHLYQTAELAELRRYHHVNKHRWGFFWFLVLGEVWPFKRIWKVD